MVHFTLPRPAHRSATVLLHARTDYLTYSPSREPPGNIICCSVSQTLLGRVHGVSGDDGCVSRFNG